MTKLKRPLNGEIVSLLTEAQLEFIKSDRSALNAEDFDYLNLKRSGDADLSLSGGVSFEWEANKQGSIQISESSTFKTYYSCDGNGECVYITSNAILHIFGESYAQTKFLTPFSFIPQSNAHGL